MKLFDLIKIVEGKSSFLKDKNIKEIKTDSRLIKKGDIFIALKGDKYDGNDYILESLKKGAIACITNKNINDKCIVVNDTFDSLYKISNYYRNKYNIPLIAITGSCGKTTTKEVLSYILSSKYKVLNNESSKNNIIGIFDTLKKIDSSYDIIVLELGSNHLGEIEYLSKLVKPNTAIITNIGTSHIEYFKSKKNIFKEKSSIVNGMKNKNLIINGDDRYLKKIDGYKCGIKSNNDLIAYDIKENIDSVTFKIGNNNFIFNNPGSHFINDILLAIKTSIDYNIDINTIIKRLEKYKLLEKRMNIINLKNSILINDCYNASYESIKAGLSYLNNINNRKVIILADMLELGKYSIKIHKSLNKELDKISNKEVLTLGNYSKYINGKHFNNIYSLIDYLKTYDLSNCYIYVKGSRRMNLDKIIDYLTKYK